MIPKNKDGFKRGSNAVRRAISLVAGPAYICLISASVAAFTGSPFFVVSLVVAATAAIEMLIICELAKRSFLHNKRDKSFGLATLLLLVTGVAIYLGVLSLLVRSYADELADLSLITLIPFSGFAFLFMAYSTIVLAYFADGLLWAVNWAAKKFRTGRKQQSVVSQGLPKSDGTQTDSSPQ